MTLISKTKTCLGMSKVTFETNNQVQLKKILERQDIWTHKVKIERRLKNRRIHFISEGWIHVKWKVFRVTLEVESKLGAGPKEDVPDNWKLYPPCLGPRLVLGFIFGFILLLFLTHLLLPGSVRQILSGPDNRCFNLYTCNSPACRLVSI